jgi:nicotinamide-nucleotide amidase
MTAHLLTIGDEILIGQIIDTNSSWMGRALNLKGIRVTSRSSVGDTRDAIRNGIAHAEQQADVVIMTGGLGPTKDDITKKVLAEIFESEMVFHEPTYSRIEGYFVKINRPVPYTMRDQATLPDKATILTNKVGTAPGMWFEQNHKVYIALPGVPFEMEYLMNHEVIPRLTERFQSRPIAHRTLLTAGEGETNIEKRIENFENNLPAHLKIAYLPGLGQVRLRLTGVWEGAVTPDSEAQLAAELDVKIAEMEAIIPDLVFGREEETLAQVVGQKLLARNWQIGTAESCTGGYIAHLITEVPGASAYFPGAIVAYSYEMKQDKLGVPAALLASEGAVSEACVKSMAEGALSALQVDVAVAVSGIAGPSGGTPEKPVGTVWMAVASKEKTVAVKYIFGRDRQKNIELTGTYALNLVRKFLDEK